VRGDRAVEFSLMSGLSLVQLQVKGVLLSCCSLPVAHTLFLQRGQTGGGLLGCGGR
jgi:hypothetical protein